MKRKSLFYLLLVSFTLFINNGVKASELTHAIGNTGYMIEEAMDAKANKKDPENYYEAIKLQRQAKKYFRGQTKHGRSLSKAMELTKKAYNLAKTARDNALKH